MKRLLHITVLVLGVAVCNGCIVGTSVSIYNDSSDQTIEHVSFGGASGANLAPGDYTDVQSCDDGAHTVVYRINGQTYTQETEAANSSHCSLSFSGMGWTLSTFSESMD